MSITIKFPTISRENGMITATIVAIENNQETTHVFPFSSFKHAVHYVRTCIVESQSIGQESKNEWENEWGEGDSDDLGLFSVPVDVYMDNRNYHITTYGILGIVSGVFEMLIRQRNNSLEFIRQNNLVADILEL